MSSRAQHQGIGMTSSRTRDRLICRLRDKGILNEDVLEAMNRIPRHIFVDEALASRAYEDTALPIGFGQTISQPYIVARMTEALLRDGPVAKVLEVGTGSAYQAAILSQLVTEVYSVERISALLDRAQCMMKELNISNTHLRYSDGTVGLPDEAPFDGIIATAAPLQIPKPLLLQLTDGGRLVIPFGARGRQRLSVITRRGDEFEEEVLAPVTFVPMLGGCRS